MLYPPPRPRCSVGPRVLAPRVPLCPPTSNFAPGARGWETHFCRALCVGIPMQIHIYHILYEFLFGTAIMAPFMPRGRGGRAVVLRTPTVPRCQPTKKIPQGSFLLVLAPWRFKIFFFAGKPKFSFSRANSSWLRTPFFAGTVAAPSRSSPNFGAPDAHGATVPAN